MKAKLSQISDIKRNQIFEIEYSILPILLSSGLILQKQDIVTEILKDLNQIVITYEHEFEVRGVFRYSNNDDHIFIKSLFLSSEYNGFRAFVHFAKEIYSALKEEELDSIQSVVQSTNNKSLKLHRKLGFQVLKQNSKAIRFEIKRKVLITNLEKYLRLKK